MLYTKWIIYAISFNVHSDIKTEVLLLLLFVDKEPQIRGLK